MVAVFLSAQREAWVGVSPSLPSPAWPCPCAPSLAANALGMDSPWQVAFRQYLQSLRQLPRWLRLQWKCWSSRLTTVCPHRDGRWFLLSPPKQLSVRPCPMVAAPAARRVAPIVPRGVASAPSFPFPFSSYVSPDRAADNLSTTMANARGSPSHMYAAHRIPPSVPHALSVLPMVGSVGSKMKPACSPSRECPAGVHTPTPGRSAVVPQPALVLRPPPTPPGCCYCNRMRPTVPPVHQR